METDVKVTVTRETRRRARILAGHMDIPIKEALARAVDEALSRIDGADRSDTSSTSH